MSLSKKRKTIFKPNDDTFEIIDELNKLANSGDYVFRGYNDKKEMLPKIIRYNKYTNHEESILRDFEKYGSQYYNAVSAIDFMSNAQHFDLPTRLLDFTRNPFIALFFALHKEKNDSDDYYYLCYASLSKNINLPYINPPTSWLNVAYPHELLADKACSCITNAEKEYKKGDKRDINNIFPFEKYEDNPEISIKKRASDQKKFINDAIIFIDPNQSNQRINMQQGLFMFPYTLEEGKHLEIIARNTKCLRIHKTHRKELLHYLNSLGYNTFRLMPDLGSICYAIREKYDS